MQRWTNGERFYGLVVAVLAAVALIALLGYIAVQIETRTADTALLQVVLMVAAGLVGVIGKPRESHRAADAGEAPEVLK